MSHSTIATQQKKGIPRLLELAGQKKQLLLLSSLLAVLHVALALIPYILTYYIILEALSLPLDLALITHYLYWAAGAAIISYGSLYASGVASHIAAYVILYRLRQQLAYQIGQLPLGVSSQYSSGVLKKIVVDDVERIEAFVAHQIPDFIKGLTLPIITIGYLFYVDWRLAAISFVPLLIVLIWVPLVFSSEYTKTMMKQYQDSQEAMNSGIVEFVRAIPVMKIFAQAADQFQHYGGVVNTYDKFAKQWLKQSAPPFAVFMSFMNNAVLPILILGLYLYQTHDLSFATLVLFLILGVGYTKPLFALTNMGMQIVLINEGITRIDQLLYTPLPPPNTTSPTLTNYSICFEQVSFSYDNQQNALDDVSFTLPEHSITALIGPSGAGKSTVAQLLARFWEVDQGRILIGGQDIKSLSTETLYEIVSFVFQDSFMFQETIYENIRMGMDKSMDEIIAAAKAAQCHKFIAALPNGYQTKLGAKGIHLSGGEQQRIQIARILLKDAPILILDEATAFSDPENEHLIQQAFSQLIKDKTVIVIAHRLNTIVHTNQIIVFDEGQIRGMGTHTTLLQDNPLYNHLWKAQLHADAFHL